MITFMYKGQEVYLQVSEYITNPMGIAIQMFEAASREPISTITTNLGNNIGNEALLSIYCNFIDENNYGKEILDFLEENNLAEPYTRFGEAVTKQSGFAEYPLYAFNPDLLKECDPDGCAEYEETYLMSLQKERDNLMQNTRDLYSKLEWESAIDFNENDFLDPIGKIEYLGFNGEVVETVEYTDPELFERDIKAENYIGAPMKVVLYRDREEGTISHEFIYECDPPLQGLSIEDCPSEFDMDAPEL